MASKSENREEIKSIYQLEMDTIVCNTIILNPTLLQIMAEYFILEGCSKEAMQTCKGFRDATISAYRCSKIPPLVKLRLAAFSGNKRLVKFIVGNACKHKLRRKRTLGFLLDHSGKNLIRMFEENLFSTIGTFFFLQQFCIEDLIVVLELKSLDPFRKSDGYLLAWTILVVRMEECGQGSPNDDLHKRTHRLDPESC
jgi:hypothetical protein